MVKMLCPAAEKNKCNGDTCSHAEIHEKNDFCFSGKCLDFIDDVSCTEVALE